MKLLSKREIEIIKYRSKGYGEKEIAKFTGLHIQTIKEYTSRLKKKLKAKNMAHAISIALNENLIDDD